MKKQRQPKALDYTECNEKWAKYCRQKAKEMGGITATPFSLANPLPKHVPWKGEPVQKCRQKVLLTGLDCIAGQQDLFT